MNPDDEDGDSGDERPIKVDDEEQTNAERLVRDPRLTEAVDHALAKQEAAGYQPTRDELRDAEPDANHWQAAVAARRRENLLGRASAAESMPKTAASIMSELADKSREWLLDRLAELREIAAAVPGGAQLAHRDLEARSIDDVPTEEVRSQVADLELALAAELSSR